MLILEVRIADGIEDLFKEITRYLSSANSELRGEPRLELGVHIFGIMWNYFGIH